MLSRDRYGRDALIATARGGRGVGACTASDDELSGIARSTVGSRDLQRPLQGTFEPTSRVLRLVEPDGTTYVLTLVADGRSGEGRIEHQGHRRFVVFERAED